MISPFRQLTMQDVERINARNAPRQVRLANMRAPVEPPKPSGRPKVGDGAEKRRQAKRRKYSLSEHTEQCLLIQWWDLWAPSKGLDPRLLAAVPNAGAGAQSGQAGKMKAEGVRAGYPDLLLDLATAHFHGLRIEMKSREGRVSPEQAEYHDLLRRNNYDVRVCYGAGEAIDCIRDYVGRWQKCRSDGAQDADSANLAGRGSVQASESPSSVSGEQAPPNRA